MSPRVTSWQGRPHSESIASIGRRQGLPAVLLTRYAADATELAICGVLRGSFSLLRKPVEARVLAECVSVLLEGKEAAAGRDGASNLE
jgi:hypothetical protein